MNTHPLKRAAHRGLTLIEVMIVIAILLAIGGLVVVNLLPRQDEANIKLAKVQIDQIANALDLFKLDMNRYPTEDEGLRALWSRDAIEDEEEATNWTSAYLKDPTPRDHWGSEWIYRYPGEIRGEAFFDIISLGPDKEEDTDDDITNHDRFLNEEGEVAEEFEDFTTPDDNAGGG